MMRNYHGYTLIELALVVAIVGVLLGGGLSAYKNRSEANKYHQTEQTIRQIDTAIKNYYAMNGFLPCPADGAQADGTANFGIAVAYDTNFKSCANPNTAPAGLAAEPRGVVPVRTIGLDDSFAYDGWGRKISYAVSPGLGSQEDFMNEQNNGTLKIINSSGVQVSNSEYGAAYAIFSHGRNGEYAFLKTGGYNLTGADVGIEARNASVVDKTLVMGPLASNFDDILLYRSKTEVYLVRRLVRPFEIQKAVCTNARTIVDYGLSNLLTTTYGSAYTDHIRKIYEVATIIDRLCYRGGPKDSGSMSCIANLSWLTSASAHPRTYPDCYCDVDLNSNPDQVLVTDFTVENFGSCQ